MKIKNVRTRLLIILLPVIFVILSVLSGVSYYFSKQALTKSVEDTAKAISSDYSNRVQTDVELLIAEMNDLANVDFVREGTDKTRVIAAMSDMKQRLGVFGVMSYASPDGSAITSDRKTTSYKDREYFKKVMSTKKPAISEPTVSKTTGKLVVVLAVPIVNNGQITGMLVSNVSLDRLSDMMKNLKYLETGYGQVVDESGLIIAHPKQPELVGKLNLLEKNINPELNLQQSTLDERLVTLFSIATQSNKQLCGFYNFVDDVERMAVCTPINLPGDRHWVMVVAAPTQEFTRDTNALAKTMLVISVLCLIIAVISIIFIARQFTRPIEIIRDDCMLLAQGDLRDQKIQVHSEDEIGQLAQGFHVMRKHLQELVGTIHSQSEQLAASSEELTANSEQSAETSNQIASSIVEMAAGATEQTEAANDASAVVEQMSASIQQIAANTNQLSDHSSYAAVKAQNGDTAVEKVVHQMSEIENTVNTSAQVIAKLGEQSKEIGQIVNTISSIAGQTNLLALNAAIEAARAGEQGRGFAVVAEEVRKLAEQSQEAAKKIAELIKKIQDDTNKAVVAMNEGTKEVKTGTEVVNAAGIAFKEIMDVVAQVSNQVSDISGAIQQMAAGSQQIVDSVKRIDDLSKKSASESQGISAATEEQLASMEEIASSSQSLAELAQNLRAAVSKFKV